MLVESHLPINAPKPAVWAAITNIEHAAQFITGIEKIEILEKPATGLVGLKWRETRMLFGKPAAVDKWITQATENESYQTKAQDGDFVFLTTRRLSEINGVTTLTESHETLPQGMVARLMSLPMFFFKGTIKKFLLQDLSDIKKAVEQN